MPDYISAKDAQTFEALHQNSANKSIVSCLINIWEGFSSESDNIVREFRRLISQHFGVVRPVLI